MSKCVPCLQGMPQFCERNGECYGNNARSEMADLSEVLQDSDEEDYERRPKRLRKNVSQLKDPHSTGRKEAAQLYPLDTDAECEWKGLVKAGGGENPIKGCGLGDIPVGKQQARHHGPDKNTMNNEKGNVHRICHRCHNRWHVANDEDYDPNAIKQGD